MLQWLNPKTIYSKVHSFLKQCCARSLSKLRYISWLKTVLKTNGLYRFCVFNIYLHGTVGSSVLWTCDRCNYLLALLSFSRLFSLHLWKRIFPQCYKNPKHALILGKPIYFQITVFENCLSTIINFGRIIDFVFWKLVLMDTKMLSNYL